MTEILLVRHGQTDWNLEKRIQGHADIPLNSIGLTQAQLFAESIKGDLYDAVFSSDLQRARQTAEVIANQLSVSLHCDNRFREVNHGEWEGLLIRDVLNIHGSEYKSFRDDLAGARPPAGETLGEAILRMEAAVDSAAAKYPKGRILIVSHGLLLAIFRCRINHLPLNLSSQFGLDNCSGETIHWEPGLI